MDSAQILLYSDMFIMILPLLALLKTIKTKSNETSKMTLLHMMLPTRQKNSLIGIASERDCVYKNEFVN